MPRPVNRIFVHGFPGLYGGAGTELHHQLRLWRKMGLAVHLIPSCEARAEPLFGEMLALGVRVHNPHDWTAVERGDPVITFCDGDFLDRPPEIRRRTSRTVFVNCMTWLFPKEKEAMCRGNIAIFLYQNDAVRQAREAELRALNPAARASFLTFSPYFDSSAFPFVRERPTEFFGCGRISRQDVDKFARNTLHIYEYFVAPAFKRGLFLGFDRRSEEKIGKPFAWIRVTRDQTECSQQEFYRHCEIVLQPSDTTYLPARFLHEIGNGRNLQARFSSFLSQKKQESGGNAPRISAPRALKEIAILRRNPHSASLLFFSEHQSQWTRRTRFSESENFTTPSSSAADSPE